LPVPGLKHAVAKELSQTSARLRGDAIGRGPISLVYRP
jgi:hypothetical protein